MPKIKIRTRSGEIQIVSANMHKAIEYKCMDCSCWNKDEVTNCPVDSCSLYYFRPFQTEMKRRGSTVNSDTPALEKV